MVSSLPLHSDRNLNFAAFFGLQRFLHKWGGEYLTKYSDVHVAYDFLFLSLYREEPPAEFTEPEYARQWEAISERMLRNMLPSLEGHFDERGGKTKPPSS